MRTLTLALLLASAAFPQTDGNVDGPVLGFVFDSEAGGIRPLLGVPGSSLLGKSLNGAAGLRHAAAGRDFALAVEADGTAVLLSATGRLPLPGAGQGAGRIVVSPRGSAAALYFVASATAQIFTGIPDSPRFVRAVTLDAPAAAMAIADDGAMLLAASRNGRDGEAVFGYSAGQSAQILHRARLVSALAFVPGTADALVADGSGVKLISPAFGMQTVGDALADVVAVAASGDGARVFAATRAGQLVIHDLRTSTRTAVECGCASGVLSPLRGNAVFRLNELGGGPLWLLDGDSPEPRILFIAAPVGGSR